MENTGTSFWDGIKDHWTQALALGAIGGLLLYTAFRRTIFKKKVEPNLLEENRPKYVIKICLTGGPCGGKTTTLTRLYDKLTSEGI